MTNKKLNTTDDGISGEFGYYPSILNFQSEDFSVQTLTEYDDIVAEVSQSENVIRDWIYPRTYKYSYSANGTSNPTITLMPYNQRIFSMQKTHILTLHNSNRQGDLNFVIWCLSFFTGIRLTTTGAGFLDATPVKLGKLVDFRLSDCTGVDAIKLALKYLESERCNDLSLIRVAAAINALYLAQRPYSLTFETFQYLYMALDTCFRLVYEKEKRGKKPTHKERIQWMCDTLGLSTPAWANTENGCEISIFRNDMGSSGRTPENDEYRIAYLY